jgi:TonB family protein
VARSGWGRPGIRQHSAVGRPLAVRTAGIEAGKGPFLDLERALAQTAAERPAPGASWRRGLWLGLALSLALHLLPLLFLLQWRAAPVEVSPAIPVALVVEQPPPSLPEPVATAEPAEPASTPPPEPPRGRLASEEAGATADEPDTAVVPSPEPPQAVPTSEATPEPELRQAANLVSPEREPTLLGREALTLPTPSFEPLSDMPAAPPPPRQKAPAPQPRPPQRAALVEGPPAVRNEYLAYLVTLVRPHLYLLPPEVIRGRRGTTSLAIRVLGDGTIARIAVSESSGHPDIDARVMQIVASVGRFPPLPPWVEQPSWDINFHLRFPFPQAGGGR